MGREISLFADYHQKENSLSNYCGLLMKMLYEDSPNKFQELLTTLLKTDIDIIVGPTFRQQEEAKDSVPDLLITQKSFSIFFEVKKYDWFHKVQIDSHVNSLESTAEMKILFLLSNFDNDNLEVQFQEAIINAHRKNIILKPLSFEDFVNSIEQVCTTDYLKNTLEDFKIYVDRNGLLPKWKHLLEVVSCSRTLTEIKAGVYMCPDAGGAYSHRRAKYFGAYAAKRVSVVFEIRAVVVVDKNLGEAEVKWINDESIEESVIEQAKQRIRLQSHRIEENKLLALQVFLLENPQETNFIKGSSGGMLQSKKYFWDIALDCKNSKDLADKLYDRKWSDVYSN